MERADRHLRRDLLTVFEIWNLHILNDLDQLGVKFLAIRLSSGTDPRPSFVARLQMSSRSLCGMSPGLALHGSGFWPSATVLWMPPDSLENDGAGKSVFTVVPQFPDGAIVTPARSQPRGVPWWARRFDPLRVQTDRVPPIDPCDDARSRAAIAGVAIEAAKNKQKLMLRREGGKTVPRR